MTEQQLSKGSCVFDLRLSVAKFVQTLNICTCWALEPKSLFCDLLIWDHVGSFLAIHPGSAITISFGALLNDLILCYGYILPNWTMCFAICYVEMLVILQPST